jgi:integrase
MITAASGLLSNPFQDLQAAALNSEPAEGLLELTTGIRRGQICGLKWSAVHLDTGEITVHDNRVVVGGRTRDKAGGKTHSADKAISIDRATVPVLRRWRKLQNGEREFFGPTITQATTGSPSRTAGHRTPTRLDVRVPDSLVGFSW